MSTERDKLRDDFATSRYAKELVIPVLSERLLTIEKSWHVADMDARDQFAEEKRVILQIAGWLGLLMDIEPDAPSVSFGHPSSAPGVKVGT